MKAWYENLIGRSVVYVNPLGKRYNCIVSNMDYNLGLTLQAKNDPKWPDGMYVFCKRGPSTPLNGHTKRWRAKRNKEYRQKMTYYAKGIRKGIIKEIVDSKGRNPSAETCPFSQ